MRAEDWLDPAVLKAVSKKKPPLGSGSDVGVTREPPRPKVSYDPALLEVTLPKTGKVERLEYVPPELTLSDSEIGPASAAEPRFVLPPERFDAFEHFQYEWIDIPGLPQSE
jgi:hypothetical protein